jgi:hypothetical protein
VSNLKRLADIRNDIKHMHPNHAPALIQEAIADAMPIIRDVIVKELNEEPSALLGSDAWDALLNELPLQAPQTEGPVPRLSPPSCR